MFLVVNDLESAFSIFSWTFCLLKKKSENTRKLTLYMHEGAKGGFD